MNFKFLSHIMLNILILYISKARTIFITPQPIREPPIIEDFHSTFRAMFLTDISPIFRQLSTGTDMSTAHLKSSIDRYLGKMSRIRAEFTKFTANFAEIP